MSKFCTGCGNTLADEAKFCGTCGTKVAIVPVQAPIEEQVQAPVKQEVVEQSMQEYKTRNIEQEGPKVKKNKGVMIFGAVMVLVLGFYLYRTVMGWFGPDSEIAEETRDLLTEQVSDDKKDTTNSQSASKDDTLKTEVVDNETNEDVVATEDSEDPEQSDSEATDTTEATGESDIVDQINWTNELFGGRFVASDAYILSAYSPENATYETIYETNGSAFILPDGINPFYPYICTTDVTEAGSRVRLIDLSTMEEKAIELSENNDSVAVSWSPDGELLAIGNDGKVYIYKLQEDALYVIDEDDGIDFAWTADSSGLYYTTHGYGTGFVRLKLKIMGGGIEELYSFESEGVRLEFEMENGGFSSDVFYIHKWSSNTQEILEYKGIGFQYGQEDIYLYDNYQVMYDEYLEWLGLSGDLIGQIYSPNLNTFPEFTYPGASVLFIDVRGEVTAYYVDDVSQSIYMGNYTEFEVVTW